MWLAVNTAAMLSSSNAHMAGHVYSAVRTDINHQNFGLKLLFVLMLFSVNADE